MFGDQRPAAPWTNHNFWGQYDSPGDLPNVAGAQLQLATDEVQAGDIAWSRSDGQLYVCLDPTRGAADWLGLLSLIPSSTTTHLYIAADAATANDSGPGTIAEPLATLDEALTRVNRQRIVTSATIVHLAAAPVNGPYRWSVTLGPLQCFRPVVLIGDGAGQGSDGFTQLSSGTAAAGSGDSVVVDGGFAVDEFQGKTIELTSGNAAGNRRTLRNNTASNLVPCARFSAAVQTGDAYRIVEPAVVIRWDTGTENGKPPVHMQGVGSPANWGPSGVDSNAALSSILLANLRFEDDGVSFGSDFRIADSMVYIAGVELGENVTAEYNAAASAEIYSGVDRYFGGAGGDIGFFELPVTLGLASDAKDWLGWCAFVTEDATSYALRHVSGFIVKIDNPAVPTGILCQDARWDIWGGAFRKDSGGGGIDGLLQVRNSILRMEGADTDLPVLVQADATGGGDGASVLKSTHNSYVVLAAVDIVMQGSVGLGLSVGGDHVDPGGAVLVILDNVSIDAPRVAIAATVDGQLVMRDLPTLVSAPSVAECATFSGREDGTPVATSTLADLGSGEALRSHTPAWTAGIAVVGDQATLSVPGQVIAVEATVATSAGPKQQVQSGAPAAGSVNTSYDVEGVATLTFNGADAVTECAVQIMPTRRSTATISRLT